MATHKAPGQCLRCGGAMVGTDMESERQIVGLLLCVKALRVGAGPRSRRRKGMGR